MGTTTKGVSKCVDCLPDNTAPMFRKVLIVDDDPAMLRILMTILESAGYEVTCATDGSKALEELQQDLPSFLITDWDMPILSGDELCQIVRSEELPQYVYIIMVTGLSTNRLAEGLLSGADEFVTKPVKKQELLARMNTGARILKLEKDLRLLASRDPLTELVNRRTLLETLDVEWKRWRRTGCLLSCVMIDVDLFKRVNDTYGHMAGDAVLRSVSRLFKNCSRETDCVCRYGGEEFAVILPDTDENGAVQWAERYRLAVAQTPVCVDQASIHVTVSLGVAERSANIATPDMLLGAADLALLEAKRAGRNQVIAFGLMGCADS